MSQNAPVNGGHVVRIVPESCLANNKGLAISTASPIIQKINLIGVGTNIDANHIPAAIENPIEYLVVS